MFFQVNVEFKATTVKNHRPGDAVKVSGEKGGQGEK
jgi:hypothetical protein